MKNHFFTRIILLFFVVSFTKTLSAQSHVDDLDLEKLTKHIISLDSTFFAAYNVCDLEKMRSFLSDDLEFYHDKGGLTRTADSLINSSRTGMCSNENYRLRREVLKGTYKVFPMKNYGAILTGEHIFYIVEKGKKERLDGVAKFTHLWHYKNNEWRMTRVLSYDHQPASYNLLKESITLSDEILNQFIGGYKGTQNSLITIKQDDRKLIIEIGESFFTVLAESENKFYLPERDVQFEFVKGSDKKVQKMIVRENGAIVEEAKKLK